MSSTAHLYVVAYDISSPRRWRRVQKLIKAICRRDLRRVMHHRDDRLIVLDLGPAHSSAAQVKIMNPASDIADLDAAIL
jgi:hypothetical protein